MFSFLLYVSDVMTFQFSKENVIILRNSFLKGFLLSLESRDDARGFCDCKFKACHGYFIEVYK